MNLRMTRVAVDPITMAAGCLVTTDTGLTAITTDKDFVVVLHDTENERMVGIVLHPAFIDALTWHHDGAVTFGAVEA